MYKLKTCNLNVPPCLFEIIVRCPWKEEIVTLKVDKGLYKARNAKMFGKKSKELCALATKSKVCPSYSSLFKLFVI